MSRWPWDEPEGEPLTGGPRGDEFLDRTHYCALHGQREWNGGHTRAWPDGEASPNDDLA